MKKEKTDKKNNPAYIGAVKFWAWQSRGLSAAVQFIVLSGFISVYCTNMLGLNAAVVGIILAASKVFDAVTDLFAGYLVDRTETKIGKGRPYELALIGLWLCTWLIFSVPAGLSKVMKYVWVMVFYVATNAVFSTLLSASSNAYTIRAFKTHEQRVKISSFGGIVIMFGSIAVNVIFPTLQKTIATSLSGWSLLVGMFAVIFGVIGMLRFLLVKEDVAVEVGASEKITMKDALAVLKTNKYVYMVCGMWLIYYLVTGMGIGTYFYTYVVGDISVMGTMSLFSVLVLPVMFFFPKLLKKMTMGQLVMVACVLYVINGILMFVAGANIAILAAASLVAGLAALPITYLTDLMLLDCGTYNAYINGNRMDGVICAIKGFTGKVGSALGSALVGVMLSLGGFVSSEGTSAVAQPESALLMMRILVGIVPAVLFAVLFFIMRYYDVEKKLPEIQKELEARKA